MSRETRSDFGKTTRLVEVMQLGSDTVGVLDLPPKFLPVAGQYLPCQRLTGGSEILVTPLFRVIGSEGALSVGPLPGEWLPGEILSYLPPQGNGFNLPRSARRVALVAFGTSPIRLLPLVAVALEQGASVSLFCDPNPSSDLLNRVSSQVEVAPLSALFSNLDWPDYLAFDIPRVLLNPFFSRFPLDNPHLEGQVLVQTPMPCRGLAECGVCAVRTVHGFRLACVDGPVFPLKEVIGVAQ